MRLLTYMRIPLFLHSCKAFTTILTGVPKKGSVNPYLVKMTSNENMFENEHVTLSNKHHVAARLCRDVYDDKYLMSCEEFIDNSETDCQVIITKEEKTIFVCFRGSDSKQDWKLNFKSSFTQFPFNSARKVHTGFAIQWLSVKEGVIDKLRIMLDKYDGKVDRVIFCGHSLGSISNLALLSITTDKREMIKKEIIVEGITFGGPRIGNKEFKDYFEKHASCTRIVLDRDLVTRVPFWYGYRHVGDPIQIRKDKLLYRDTTTWETITWLLKGIFLERDFGVKDHDINRYYKEIGNIIFNNED